MAAHSPASCPAPDQVRGRLLCRASTSWSAINKKDVDGRDEPTAVRLDFCRRSAWHGFLWVSSVWPRSRHATGTHALLHQNSVLHSLLKHVPWNRLEQVVENYGADDASRGLTTKRQLIALLYGQFSGAASLREIVTGMESHATRLYHVGAAPVKR